MGKCVGWVKQGLGYVPWAGWQFGCALVIDEGPVINEPRLLRGEFDNRMCGAFYGGCFRKYHAAGFQTRIEV